VKVVNGALGGRSVRTWLYDVQTTMDSSFFCDDHTHFERTGADQLGELIAKALRDQKLGLADYLK
jgi:hypothetical protein